MSAAEELDEVSEVVPLVKPAEETVLDVIKRRRAEHVADQFYDMLPPGFDGCLVLRCSALSGEAQTATRVKLAALERKKDPTRDFAINADTLIAVCEEVLARKTRTDPLVPLVPGETVRIDWRLAEVLGVPKALGLEPEQVTARMLLKEVFRGAPSPEISIGVHVNDYLEWAQGLEADTDEGLMGES
jgi:hypothetical protein